MVDARFAEALAEAEAIDTELEGLDADERRERCRRQPFLGVPFSTKVMTLGVPISTKVNHLFPGLLPSDRPLLDSWFARQVSIKVHDHDPDPDYDHDHDHDYDHDHNHDSPGKVVGRPTR